jgi:hypothetical protein
MPLCFEPEWLYHIYPMEWVPSTVYRGEMKRNERDFRKNVTELTKNVEKTHRVAKALEGEVRSTEAEVRQTEEDVGRAIGPKEQGQARDRSTNAGP